MWPKVSRLFPLSWSDADEIDQGTIVLDRVYDSQAIRGRPGLR